MTDFTQLDQSLSELEATTTDTEGVEDSAAGVIAGIAPIVKAEVAKALAEDSAVNDAAAAAANTRVAAVMNRLVAGKGKLAAAIAANNPGPAPAPDPSAP